MTLKETLLVQISDYPFIFSFSGFSLQAQLVKLVAIVDSSAKLGEGIFNKLLHRGHRMETVELDLPPFDTLNDLRSLLPFPEVDQVLRVSVVGSVVDER